MIVSLNICKKYFNIWCLVLRQASVYENNQSQTDLTDSYVSLKISPSDAGLETSCVFKNGRKNSSSANSGHSNNSGVTYRQ